MKNEITTSQAYLEASKIHNDLVHQAWLEYAATREALNKASQEEKQAVTQLVNMAANKMKAAKAARTKALNKILKAG